MTYYEAHREERLAYQKARYVQKAAALCAYQRAYRAANPAAEHARRKAWRKANPDKQKAEFQRRYAVAAALINQRNKAWREANPEKERTRKQRYASQHLEQGRAKAAKRRAFQVGTQVETVDLKKILQDANGLCGICRKPFDLFGIHFDHIVPLSKGGTHTTDNIQATHARCNLVKGAKV